MIKPLGSFAKVLKLDHMLLFDHYLRRKPNFEPKVITRQISFDALNMLCVQVVIYMS